METEPTAIFGSARGCDVMADDIPEQFIVESDFDWCICASSFEPRAIAIPELVENKFYRSGTVLFFREQEDDLVRRELDPRLLEICRGHALPLGVEQYDIFLRMFFRRIDELYNELGRPPRVLVDYSCLPKSYYVGCLLVASQTRGCELFFGYDLGQRDVSSWSAAEVDSIIALPGCEGLPVRDGRQIYLFSLGFDGTQAAAIEEILQPYKLFVLIADPGVTADSGEVARRANYDVIQQSSGTIIAPVWSVCGAVAQARDIAGMGGGQGGLVVVPLGPKPHALALGILAFLDAKVSYLYIATVNPPMRRVESASKRCWTRVRIIKSAL